MISLSKAFPVFFVFWPVWAEDWSKYVNVEQEKSVFVFSKDSAKNLLEQNRLLLLMCYVPWDRKYQLKLNDFEKVAALALKKTKDVALAKFDVSTDRDTAEFYEIDGYQLQFILFHKGRAFNFAEFSDADALITKMEAISKPGWKPAEVSAVVNRVKKLSRSDFDKINNVPFAVVLFHRDGSMAAERLAYDFELAVHSLIDVPKPFRFYKFDVSTAPSIAEKYGLDKLPRFLIFRHGKHYQWNGPYLKPKAMAAYIQKHMGPPLAEIPNPTEFDKFAKNHSDRAIVLGFFENTQLDAFPHFLEAAFQMRDMYNFVLMSNPVVRHNGGEAEQATGWSLMVMLPKKDHTPHDEKNAILKNEKIDLKMLMDFIRWKATPLAGERTFENENTVYTLRPLVVVYGRIDWSKAGKKDTEYLRDKVAMAAKDHKDTLFAVSDRSQYAHEVERFGFDMDPKYDLHVGVFGKDGEYYPRWSTTHINAKMISEFVRQFKEGEIKPYYRSTDPTENRPSEVLQLTGRTFHSEILNGKSFTHAAILLYHPKSSNWRLAEDSLQHLAKEEVFKKKKGVKFFQIDLSVNDIPASWNITKYPTISMIHSDARSHPEHYDGVEFEQDILREKLKLLIKKLKKVVQPKSKPLKSEL